MQDITPEGLKEEIEDQLIHNKAIHLEQLLDRDNLPYRGYCHISSEELEEKLWELMRPKIDRPITRVPSVTHYTAPGISAWTIDSGSSIITIGDGGIEMFEKALQEAAKKYVR